MKAARRLRQVYVLDEKGNIITLQDSPYRFPKTFFDSKAKIKLKKKLVKISFSNKDISGHE